MKKICCLIPLMILLSGCSGVSELLVINKSNRHISVWFAASYLDTTQSTLTLKAYEIVRWRQGEPVLGKQFRIAQMHDETNERYHADLPPNCAVVVGEAINVDLRDTVQRFSMLERIGILQIYDGQTPVLHCSGSRCSDNCKVYTKFRAAIVYEE